MFPLTWTLKLAKNHCLDLCRKQSPGPEGFTEIGQKRRSSTCRALGERKKGSQDSLKALSVCVCIKWETGNQKGKTAEKVDYEFGWALTEPTGHNGQHVLGSVHLALEDNTGFRGIRCKETLTTITTVRKSNWVGEYGPRETLGASEEIEEALLETEALSSPHSQRGEVLLPRAVTSEQAAAQLWGWQGAALC